MMSSGLFQIRFGDFNRKSVLHELEVVGFERHLTGKEGLKKDAIEMHYGRGAHTFSACELLIK